MQQKYIFNASFYTTPSHQPEWEEWLHKEFLPAARALIPQIQTEIFEVLSDINNEMLIFSVQIRCTSQTELKTIQKNTVPLFSDFKHRFGERATNFNSVLNKID
jgi:hypothetical protein